MLSERDKLKRVLEERNRLIDRLDAAALTKQEFHSENYRSLQRWQMKPYPVIDSLEQGIYNYQYYNTLAKEAQRRAGLLADNKRKKLLSDIRNYFHCKDDCIRQMLAICADEPVESYFIVTESNMMRDRLLEIVFLKREKFILHTLDPQIVRSVKKMGIFLPGIRLSKIHAYINAQQEER